MCGRWCQQTTSRTLVRSSKIARRCQPCVRRWFPFSTWHTELWYVNRLAKSLGCAYLFPNAEVLIPDNGERFFSQCLTKTIHELGPTKLGAYGECLCTLCANTEDMAMLTQCASTVDESAKGSMTTRHHQQQQLHQQQKQITEKQQAGRHSPSLPTTPLGILLLLITIKHQIKQQYYHSQILFQCNIRCHSILHHHHVATSTPSGCNTGKDDHRITVPALLFPVAKH